MTKRSFFLTGTDTEVGKTYVAERFLRSASQRGESAAGIKVLSAGLCPSCQQVSKMTLLADCQCDAARLKAASLVKPSLNQLNPFSLKHACSPNIAADLEQVMLNAKNIAQTHQITLQDTAASQLLFEGAGGWFTPINPTETLADVAVLLGLPVVLVVGVKLGCLNHAILTEGAILSLGCELLGWVASEPAVTEFFDEQLKTLESHLKSRCLGVVRRDQPADLAWPLV